jgi:two-component system, LytTR family, response regulator
MKQLTAILIDDEQDSLQLLRLQLQKHCQEVNILHSFQDPVAARQFLEINNVDMVFLDIEMPVMDGFQLLESLRPLRFRIIFVTAYNQYAIRAFRFNAVHYIVKPVEGDLLKEAVEKVQDAQLPTDTQIQELRKQAANGLADRIAVGTQAGVIFINLSEIIYIEAQGNYSQFLLDNQGRQVITKTLKDIQDLLEENGFLRVHRQYIIKLNKVKTYARNEGILTMMNGDHVPVARIQREKLMEKFTWL